jgi:hypothetical protein
LNIWAANGHSGSHPDKLLLYQFQRNILSMLKEYNYIFINKALKLKLIDQTIPLLRRSEILKLTNGTIVWLSEKRSKIWAQSILDQEKVKWLETLELINVSNSSNLFFQINHLASSIYMLRLGQLKITHLVMIIAMMAISTNLSNKNNQNNRRNKSNKSLLKSKSNDEIFLKSVFLSIFLISNKF